MKDAETIREEKRVKELAEKIYIALLSNPERYKYISKLISTGMIIDDREATAKNINKAYKLAKQFIKHDPFI